MHGGVLVSATEGRKPRFPARLARFRGGEANSPEVRWAFVTTRGPTDESSTERPEPPDSDRGVNRPKSDPTRRITAPERDFLPITAVGHLVPPPLPDDSDAPRPPSARPRRTGPRGGTLFARFGASDFPTTVKLRPLEGQHVVDVSSRPTEGRYVIGQELGKGGMGTVRLVRDLDLGRDVAMKVHNPEDPDAQSLRDALIAEAQTTGQLEHPNIIPVHELGVTPTGEVFYTMKAITGITLRDAIRKIRGRESRVRQEFPLRKLVQIIQQICLGLHYAHSRGVVHRDIKPDNVLLGAFGEVLVMDWGVAHVIGSRGPLSQPGLVVGTPQYMAPEQAFGRVDDIDGRSDVFSVGVLLYEILTLETPIHETNTDRALHLVRRRSAPPRPAARPGDPPIPDELADICQRAMNPDPTARFQSARELHEALEAFLEGSAENERRQRMANAEFQKGSLAFNRWKALLESRRDLGLAIAERELVTHRWAPLPARRELWALEEQRSQVDLSVSQAFSEAVNDFHRVLGLQPQHVGARAGLARLYLARYENAERDGDTREMLYFGDLAHRYNDGERGGPLKKGRAKVTIRSFPEGAEVRLIDVRAGPFAVGSGAGTTLGAAPVTVELEAGLYLVLAHREGYRDAHQTLFVRADQPASCLLSLRPWAAEELMLGRDNELAALRFNYERVAAGHELRRVLVTGHDGIGKNRLLNAFGEYLDSLTEKMHFFFAECREQHLLVPYGAVTELLRIRAGVRPGEPSETVTDKLRSTLEASLVDGGPPLPHDRERITRTARVLARLPGIALADAPADLPPKETRERFDLALVDFIEITTRFHPAVIVLQQIEYLDDASARVIRLAEGFLKSTAVLFVGFGTDVSAQGAWDEWIRLQPLGEAAAHALTRGLLRAAPPRDLVSWVMEVSGGVPWLIIDTVKRLALTGHLRAVSGQCTFDPVAAGVATRTSMMAGRRRQLAELPVELAVALRVASAIGDTFWLEALDALGIAQSEQVCRALVERELVRELPTSRYPGTHAFAFRSALFREVVYDSIEDSDACRRLHDAIADWVRARFQSDICEVAELARHTELAQDEMWASHLYAQLGDVCHDHGFPGMARECWQRALEHATDDDDRARIGAQLDAIRGEKGG